MLGVGGDQYLSVPPGFKVAYLSWENTPEVVTLEDNKFRNDDIKYEFVSKSGGDILNTVLAVRLLTKAIFEHLPENTVILPRMNSIMVLTGGDISLAENVADLVSQGWLTPDPWIVTFHPDRRVA
jgi:hypothetical protein